MQVLRLASLGQKSRLPPFQTEVIQPSSLNLTMDVNRKVVQSELENSRFDQLRAL